VWSFSPDGRHLAYHQLSSDAKYDLWTLPLDHSDSENPKPGDLMAHSALFSKS
jgi:hypothetical protein